MSIFDKFTKKTDDQSAIAEEVVSKPETAKVDIAKKDADNKKEVKNDVTVKIVKKTYGILVKPLITEKAANLAQLNQYVFAVANKANKIQISQAIEARYGIKPVSVNVLNNSGKTVRRGRDTGRTKDWRKAIVTLPAGKTIQIHEGV
ncbi:50S ribosomal protein L23 [Candidatus Falkowbacteria bacterium]|uniref:Large ribosomal subunit protein uL23 n=1 Tax=Candidatus Buchananbacteria bacterium CG10_big_fil_rev_8_21_14_0_10_33_19 TaxID=1974525 RepID=A0A2H0W308_9BACT|nr:50S ribosomal protein L23 [Candidatus Falkowbacteria bacterium]PIS05726.1 MAG: 50S ribosomal protein L23 [Candidatus Buchananbacteria bacterium CG10_big_fil_rev_8_21_14_0_10_33_19]